MDRQTSEMILYRLHGCPYCERIARLLDRYGLSYRSKFVAAEHSRRDAVKRVAGTRSVPVLVDGDRGVTMAESANIVEYLERSYSDRHADGDIDSDEHDGAAEGV